MPKHRSTASARNIGGAMVRPTVEFLRDLTPDGTLERVLRAAEETRPLDVLLDETVWSSYQQFRRLLEAAAAELGGPDQLLRVGAESTLFNASSVEYIEMLQHLGSPAALLENVEAAARHASAVFSVRAKERAPNHWSVCISTVSGFEPFRELCQLSAGLVGGLIPRLFGCAAAEITELACQCNGDPECRFEIRWEVIDEAAQRNAYLETRATMLEARLGAFQETVTQVVSCADADAALRCVVEAAQGAMRKPIFVLALHSPLLATQRVYSYGLDDASANRIATEILEDPTSGPGRLVAPIMSIHGRYGHLAAIDPTLPSFSPNELTALASYARLAAAALDSASAIERARHEETTARVLLDLSMSLADIVSVEEMAAKLARAVPVVVDCDRSIIALYDLTTRTGRVAATWGYSRDHDHRLRSYRVPVPPADQLNALYTKFVPGETGDDLIETILREAEAVTSATVAIVADGEQIGRIVAILTERPERLENPGIGDRLRGLAGQAATAVRNARLLDQIRHQALHDALTGLPNRVLILDRVEQMLARARRQHSAAAVLFIDLDNFKDVNDTLGHATGDRLLRAVAGRLADSLRESDTIGRLGGDEFVVLIESQTIEEGPDVVAQGLIDALAEPIALEGCAPLVVTASIGIAAGDRPSASDLLRDADVALYRAKARGKACYVLFHPDMQEELKDRIGLEADLRDALGAKQFHLAYQPIFDLRDNRVTGVEALLRWTHPERGHIAPEVIVPVLEETGEIVAVGRWVLEEACAQAACWHRAGHVMDISVNVSMRQLDKKEFVDDLRYILTDTGLDPSTLVLEITETAIMQNPKTTIERLTAVKELGVRIAIDDFGTGYSSLSYLQQFPVDSLKIDRSFITSMSDDPQSNALIRSLVQLGKSLGLNTLAEGIENQQQYWQLQLEHCDSGQGFLLAEPLDVAAIDDFLATKRSIAGESLHELAPTRRQ